MIAFKQISKAALVVAVIAILPACWPFSKKVEAKVLPSLYIINVLDKSSYEDCRITGSTNVPFDQVESFAKGLDKNAEIVVYCANYMCTASGASAQKLKELGFEKVWAYEGGSAQWYQLSLQNPEKYKIEGACAASYVRAPNEKPTESEPSLVPVIEADELYQKMVTHGIIIAEPSK